MRMMKKLFDFVFCCLSEEERLRLDDAMENNQPGAVYAAQRHLLREKHGYRCGVCGKFYPYIELDHQDRRTDPRKISKMKGSLRKGKKAAAVFRGEHYYAQYKKTLLKFEADSNGAFQQTNMIPIMGDVYHTIVSGDERYIATETFSGTIAVVEAGTGQLIAKKRHTDINGNFIFTQDQRLLYFHNERIILWDFAGNAERVVWEVPAAWKERADSRIHGRIVCANIIFNPREQTYLFVCDTRDKTYIVALKDMEPAVAAELPGKPVHSEMVFEETLNRYTLPTYEHVVVYDGNFRVLETIVPPRIIENADGGGVFPVTRYVKKTPQRVFLSPDGNWLLLDYFTSVILMPRSGGDMKYCLYSYTGKVARRMGFIDSSHFWYTWADTTYIQEIGN